MQTPASRPRRREKLRIAICTENFLPRTDGVTRTLSRLLQHMRDEGHEAIVLGPNSGMKSYAGHEVVGTKGLPLIVYPGLKLNILRPFFIRRLIDFDPDVIHFVDPIWLGGQLLPTIAHFLPEVPVVSSYHTNLATYASLFGFSFLTPLMWRLMRFLHSRCTLTFCPSPSTAEMLEKRGFNNIRIWPRGADVVSFNPSKRSLALRRQWGVEPAEGVQGRSKTAVLFVGRISFEKNLRLLVESFREVNARDPYASKLVFVGEGPARKEIESLCASYGIDAVFMGLRQGDELWSCFASADVFAFPSFTETFGQVVLEALASGLPVVGLNAEGVKDLISPSHNGLLLDLTSSFPDYDIADLVKPTSPTFALAVTSYGKLLEQLIRNPGERGRMAVNALAEAHKRTWFDAMEAIVEGYVDVRDAQSELSRRRREELALPPRQRRPSEDVFGESLALKRTMSLESEKLVNAEAGAMIVLDCERETRRYLAKASGPIATFAIIFCALFQIAVWNLGSSPLSTFASHAVAY